MEWFIAIIVVIVIGIAAIAASGRLGQFGPSLTDRPEPRWPEGQLASRDLDDLRLAVVPRGYAIDQVEELLARTRHSLAQWEAGAKMAPPANPPSTPLVAAVSADSADSADDQTGVPTLGEVDPVPSTVVWGEGAVTGAMTLPAALPPDLELGQPATPSVSASTPNEISPGTKPPGPGIMSPEPVGDQEEVINYGSDEAEDR